ncbi:unnamed protein product [Mytilus coruscus]|uniref:Uncharacterized protein n=1 Tax=Mytilus coruscus TaxID=42192 RepID=A0A6J8AHE3_MYTCO|nr:unnamed protein product [Mytilus coruscus]
MLQYAIHLRNIQEPAIPRVIKRWKTAKQLCFNTKSQKYKDQCISLTETLSTAMTEVYSIVTQLQTARIDLQQEREACEQYKKSSKKRIDTMKTQLQTARIDFQKERKAYKEYKKSLKETFDTMETHLQINRIDMQKEREAYEEYKMSSKKRFDTMEIENNKYKEMLRKHREIANKHKDSDRILKTSLEELEKITNENNSLKLKNSNLKQENRRFEKGWNLSFQSVVYEWKENVILILTHVVTHFVWCVPQKLCVATENAQCVENT